MPLSSADTNLSNTARFVTGSTMRHVLVMSATGSIGLFAIFFVDFLTLGYIAQLDDAHLTAAAGAASLVMFFCRSVNIGLMIAIGAMIAKTLGQGKKEESRHVTTASLIILALGAQLIALIVFPLKDIILPLVGATPDIIEPAWKFLYISLPGNGIGGLGMGFSAVLRAHGEARRAMNVTLAGAVSTALCAPVLIFYFNLGITGAAINIIIANTIIASVGFYYCSRKMQALAKPNLTEVKRYIKPTLLVGIPAIGTNLASPVGSAIIANSISYYGELAYSAYSIVDRLLPVAYCGFFALSGCIGPILGQNWGAKRYDRMTQVLKNATIISLIYAIVIAVGLNMMSSFIAERFKSGPYTHDLIVFFCAISGPFWFFNGMLFCSNASFNNLGAPYLATLFNWGRATIGVLPFAYLGSYYGGVKGILIGIVFGAVLFGCSAIISAFMVIKRLEKNKS